MPGGLAGQAGAALFGCNNVNLFAKALQEVMCLPYHPGPAGLLGPPPCTESLFVELQVVWPARDRNRSNRQTVMIYQCFQCVKSSLITLFMCLLSQPPQAPVNFQMTCCNTIALKSTLGCVAGSQALCRSRLVVDSANNPQKLRRDVANAQFRKPWLGWC